MTYKVFLNAGHGIHDPGVTNKNLKLEERNVARLITDIVAVELQNNGVDIEVFQEVNDLSEVGIQANKSNADICVSIHLNGFNTKAQGTETYYHKDSIKGMKLASSIHKELVKPIKGHIFVDRGIKNTPLYVTRVTKMPACLVEVGFLDNDIEGAFIHNHLQECAEAITIGILNYLGIKKQNNLPKLADIVIKPSGSNGLFNLIINGVLLLINNKLETIHNYLEKNYNSELY